MLRVLNTLAGDLKLLTVPWRPQKQPLLPLDTQTGQMLGSRVAWADVISSMLGAWRMNSSMTKSEGERDLDRPSKGGKCQIHFPNRLEATLGLEASP